MVVRGMWAINEAHQAGLAERDQYGIPIDPDKQNRDGISFGTIGILLTRQIAESRPCLQHVC
jgi:hypothetical protein